MKRLYRLHKESDFTLLFKRGRRVESFFFRAFVIPNALGHFRFGFIIPKASVKKAVDRNRLRRRAREWTRKNIPIDREGLDFVLFFKKEAASASKIVFYEDLRRIFSKTKIDVS